MSIFITRYTTDVVFSVGIISRKALPSDEHRRRQIPLPLKIYYFLTTNQAMPSASSRHSLFYQIHQVGIAFNSLEFWKLLFHGVRCAEENAEIGFEQHGNVIE